MNEGRKKDEDKLRFDLILPEFEEAMAHVLTHGAKKYEANNYYFFNYRCEFKIQQTRNLCHYQP